MSDGTKITRLVCTTEKVRRGPPEEKPGWYRGVRSSEPFTGEFLHTDSTKPRKNRHKRTPTKLYKRASPSELRVPLKDPLIRDPWEDVYEALTP